MEDIMYNLDTVQQQIFDIFSRQDEDVLSVVNIQNLDSYLAAKDDVIEEEIDVFSMACLSNFVLLGRTDQSLSSDDDRLHRLSLAYEKLRSVPKILIEELASRVKILDLSHNQFDNLDFLSDFTSLTSLICDHNSITSDTNIPHMPQLELLWLNHCKINYLYPWAKRLQTSCPNLRFLSLMGNPVAPSYLNGGNVYECLQYRLFIISLFPELVHLDDKPVTSDEREEAERMYKKPFVERLVRKTHNLPLYVRQISEMLTPAPSFVPPPEKNLIV